jgi:hypothetical protein
MPGSIARNGDRRLLKKSPGSPGLFWTLSPLSSRGFQKCTVWTFAGTAPFFDLGLSRSLHC